MAVAVSEAMMAGLICMVTRVGEIPYYSTHMTSAVHYFESEGQAGWQTFLKDAENVFADETIIRTISENARTYWENMPTYAESFVRETKLLKQGRDL